MPKKSIKHKKFSGSRKFSPTNIFFMIQLGLLFLSFVIHMLSRGGIISFYSLLILYTLLSFILFQMILVSIYNLAKIQGIKDKISPLCKICLVLIALPFIIFYTAKYYKDVPYAIKKEYKTVIGKCTYVYPYHGKDAHLDITIGNAEFDVSLGYEHSIKEGEYYKVVYLPNTKEVIAIYGE